MEDRALHGGDYRHPKPRGAAARRQTMEEDMIEIKGNTYPVRDQIKALGGRWDPDRVAGFKILRSGECQGCYEERRMGH